MRGFAEETERINRLRATPTLIHTHSSVSVLDRRYMGDHASGPK